MEIAQKNSGLGARDDENKVDNAEESEHIVELVRPDRVEDEEELNEDASERQDAAHHDRRYRSRVEILEWDLARDLVGAHRVLNRRLLEAEVRAEEDEWCAHAEPERE